MFIGNPSADLTKRRSNNNEVLEISGALSGSANCCYKLGVNMLTGDLYYRDINNTWQPVPGTGTGGGGGGGGVTERFGYPAEDVLAGQNRNFNLSGHTLSIVGGNFGLGQAPTTYFNVFDPTTGSDLITIDKVTYQSVIAANNGNAFSTLILNADPANTNIQFTLSATNNIDLVQITGNPLTNNINLGASQGISINSSYTLPLVDGTSGQVMVTDGAGNVTFGNVGGGGGGSIETQVNSVDNTSQIILNLIDSPSIAPSNISGGNVSNDIIVSSAPNNGTLILADGIYSPVPFKNGIIIPGVVTWISDYTYNISPSTYLFNGVVHMSPSTDVTLVTADPTLDRIDDFIVSIDNTAGVITGTPSGTPASPSIDPNTQILLGIALVSANTTQPAITPSRTYIYQENVEWTTSTNASPRISFTSVSSSIAGTLSIEGTTVKNLDYMSFVNVPATYTTDSVLQFQIKSKALWNNNATIKIQFLNGATKVGTAVVFKNASYGFISSITTDQRISIPLTDFNISGNSIDRVVFTSSIKGKNTIGFYLDEILIQSSIIPILGGDYVKTVTGNQVNNADPLNPIVRDLLEISADFASITGATYKRLIYVLADETNNGDISLYIYTGSTLKFLQTVA